jgi:hypothetical protein
VTWPLALVASMSAELLDLTGLTVPQLASLVRRASAELEGRVGRVGGN